MMKVSDIMCKKITSIGPKATLAEAAAVMKRNNATVVVVMDAGKMVGVITEGDLLRTLYAHVTSCISCDETNSAVRLLSHYSGLEDLLLERIREFKKFSVADIMTERVFVVDEGEEIGRAVRLMREFNVRLLPVVDKNLKLKGCVTRLDITNAVLNMQL